MDLVRGMKANEEDKDSVRKWKPKDEMGLNEGDGGAQGGNKDTRIVRWKPVRRSLWHAGCAGILIT